jgi:uncharacterized membrane protein
MTYYDEALKILRERRIMLQAELHHILRCQRVKVSKIVGRLVAERKVERYPFKNTFVLIFKGEK